MADPSTVSATQDTTFEAFFEMTELPLRRALIARLGIERGREATAEGLAWAYEHWPRIKAMENPAGYVYRVGVSRTRPRRVPLLAGRPTWCRQPETEPRLLTELSRLSPQQRQAVVLVCAYQWKVAEVASLTGLNESTVRTHLRRGLRRLRVELGSVDE